MTIVSKNNVKRVMTARDRLMKEEIIQQDLQNIETTLKKAEKDLKLFEIEYYFASKHCVVRRRRTVFSKRIARLGKEAVKTRKALTKEARMREQKALKYALKLGKLAVKGKVTKANGSGSAYKINQVFNIGLKDFPSPMGRNIQDYLGADWKFPAAKKVKAAGQQQLL